MASREKSKIKVESTILDSAANKIKTDGVWGENMQSNDLLQVVQSTTEQLKKGFEKFVSFDPDPEKNITTVEIKQSASDGRNVCIFDTNLTLVKPINASLHIRANWKNVVDQEGVLETTGFTYEPTADNIAMRTLKLFKVEETIREKLDKPNEVFSDALRDQMGLRDINLTHANYIINSDSIHIDLMGTPKPIVS